MCGHVCRRGSGGEERRSGSSDQPPGRSHRTPGEQGEQYSQWSGHFQKHLICLLDVHFYSSFEHINYILFFFNQKTCKIDTVALGKSDYKRFL